VNGYGRKETGESFRPPESGASGENQNRVRFNIDGERRLVIAKFGQRLTAADIQSYVRELQAHPTFESSFSEIADISDVTELPLEAPDFLKLADRTDPFSCHSKRAFVVQTILQKRAARMHEILRGQRHFAIFRTLQEAEDWITEGCERGITLRSR
jgi:hypothetical protein